MVTFLAKPIPRRPVEGLRQGNEPDGCLESLILVADNELMTTILNVKRSARSPSERRRKEKMEASPVGIKSAGPG